MLSLVVYKGSMETIVTCFVTGQKINASTIPPTSDFYLWFSDIRFLLPAIDFQFFDFRLRIFNLRLHTSDLILDIRFRVRSFTSDHWRKIFWLPASDFQFTTLDIRFRSSEFGVYFEPLTYNFLTTGFEILIHNFRLRSLQLPRLSLWTFRNYFDCYFFGLQ